MEAVRNEALFVLNVKLDSISSDILTNINNLCTRRIQELVQTHFWNELGTWITVPKSSLVEDRDMLPFQSRYTLPATMKTIIKVLKSNDSIDEPSLKFNINEGRLYIPVYEDVKIVYVKDIASYTSLSPLLYSYLVYAIAEEICMPLTNNQTLYQVMMAKLQEKRMSVMNADAQRRNGLKIIPAKEDIYVI